MSTAVISLFSTRSRSTDWTNQELAEFHRVAGILRRAGLDIEIDRGLTDEGDAWLVFCHAETGDVVAHFAHYDGHYVVSAPMLERTLKGRRFTDLVDNFLTSCPVVLTSGRARSEQRRVFIHPIAALTALIATLFFLSDLSKAQAAEDEGGGHASDGNAHGQDLPAGGAELVRDVFYRDGRMDRPSDRREDHRSGAEVHRADVVLAAIAIAVAIAAEDTHGAERKTEQASGILVADISADLRETLGDAWRELEARLERQLASAQAFYLATVDQPTDMGNAKIGSFTIEGIGADLTLGGLPLEPVIIEGASGRERSVGNAGTDQLSDANGWIDALDEMTVATQSSRSEAAATPAAAGASAASEPAHPSAGPVEAQAPQVGDAGLQSFLAAFLESVDSLDVVLRTDEETGRLLEELTNAAGAPVAEADVPVESGETTVSTDGTTTDPDGGAAPAPPADPAEPVEPVAEVIDFNRFDAYEVMLTFARVADAGVGVYQSGTDFYMYELPALQFGASEVETEHLGSGSGISIHLIGFSATFHEVWEALA